MCGITFVISHCGHRLLEYFSKHEVTFVSRVWGRLPINH